MQQVGIPKYTRGASTQASVTHGSTGYCLQANDSLEGQVEGQVPVHAVRQMRLPN